MGCSSNGVATPATAPVQPADAPVQSLGTPQVWRTSVLRRDVERTHAGAPVQEFVSSAIDARGGAAIFISDVRSDVVKIFNTTGGPTAVLKGFSQPQGLAVDAAGDLYVADTNNTRVQIYSKGYRETPVTLFDPGQYPSAVAVDVDGNVAVTNIITTAGGAGSVSLYRKGARTPSKTLSSASFAHVYFDAFDAAGNLYIDGTDANNATLVGEVVAGLKGNTIVPLATSNVVTFPGGIAVTTDDKIAIDDQAALAIYTYAAPKGGSLGAPLSTTRLTGANDPVSFAFNSANTDAYTADARLEISGKYQYPAGGTAIRRIDVGGEPVGVAVTPDASL